MTLETYNTRAELKAIMLAEDQSLQSIFSKHDVTLGRKSWQPSVINANRLNQQEVSRFINESRDLPELNINAAIEHFWYQRYVHDVRYVMGLFADIPEMNNDVGLYVRFPRTYTASSLTSEFMNLEHPVQTATRQRALEECMMFFKEHWPSYYMKFTPYGSLVSGLGFSNSFLNINIQLDDPDLQRLVEVPDPFENDITEPFCKAASIPLFQSVGAKKIQFEEDIGSLRLKHQLHHIEYNFNKEAFTYSTNLINHYMTLDPRVQTFLFAIKLFGRGRNIFAMQVKNGIRYYGYTILALAYLSQLDPPVIPNLQHVNGFSADDTCSSSKCFSKSKYWDKVIYGNKNVGIAARYHDCVEYNARHPVTEYYAQGDPVNGTLYWNSKNKSSVGELFLDFLHYYGYRFDFDNFAVSLKFNGRTAKNNWKNDAMAIEDPFMTTTNLASAVIDSKRFTEVLRGAFSILRSGTCFDDMCKKASEIARYDAQQGVCCDRPIYVPLSSWSQSATSKAFLLIGLPKLETDACYCDRIKKLFSTHGRINRMMDLDCETKQVFFSPDTGDATTIVLPSTIMLNGELVHLVELYNFTI
ncbi:hypothetical protein HPULCUR_009027 [Helicostylum pulchrum]|uniref:PAP-associated domain-containing protein n=1 Tax=Helicostylum pulchrum TaxID=562976 RepID=A0ABP9Y9V9_9FUNG